MHQLTILGLGPGHRDYLTLKAYQALKAAKVVWVRTVRHPIIEDLADEGVQFKAFDHLYEAAEDFEGVYTGIVAALLETLEDSDVLYAVPGNPFVAERAVQILLDQVPAQNVTIIHGTSFLDAIITRLMIDPVLGLSVVDALRLEESPLENHGTLVCIQCYNAVVASDLKIWLSRLYRDDHPVTIVKAVGIPSLEEMHEVPLYQLDRFTGFDHLTSVVVSDNKGTKRHTFQSLTSIMDRLRGPGGCPWDQEQSHQSLLPYVLEEAYEVADAIHQGDVFALEEELGDLLLQVVFHAKIGREHGDFALEDVLDAICEKMISRHPHVFSDCVVSDAQQVLTNWEAIKREENQHKTVTDTMRKFTSQLPALFRAYKVQSKAAKVGFDWPSAEYVFDKIQEEVEEIKGALAKGDREGIWEEVGDLLFSVVNLSRKLEVESEFVLHKAIEKFIKRFEGVEREMEENAVDMSKVGIDTLEAAWQRQKKVNIYKNK